jgi:hypothetical protein
MSGYVRLYRKMLGHPAFRNDGEALAFAWMVLRAAWRPARVRYKERILPLARGQLSVSQRDMARAIDRDKAWVERLWKRLKSEAMMTVDVEAGVTVITICNYSEYQFDAADREAVDEADGEAGARQGRGTEQVREIKEIKENNTRAGALADCDLFSEDEAPADAGEGAIGEHYTGAFEQWWAIYPNKTGKGRAAQAYQAAFKRLGGASVGTGRVHSKLFYALEAQCRVWKLKGISGKFIPHPTTWLNQSRWDDEAVIKAQHSRIVVEHLGAPAELAPPAPKPDKPVSLEGRRVLGWSPDDEQER